ncbi:2-dehydropantoate 2-reductase [Cupriavidus plantarum]|uniref:2-dehydropantoate 2-reductase n=1 Tax=Cupriavidus plantarum TaxID=942865 RepID=UPI001B1EF840|nr:2-dehydropantoate 2-reductase [Cupriavidus plantarum]CAG2151205.1 2-dehydropantoate 2-reductase [Cupriavidus plantarum]SMR65896.1 ketopantoate reductase [Cupriavidus plantarum]
MSAEPISAVTHSLTQPPQPPQPPQSTQSSHSPHTAIATHGAPGAHVRQRVAVIGAGGVGLSVAACLAVGARHDVTLCARAPMEAIGLEAAEGMRRVTVRTLTDPAQATPVDWILLCTKAQDTASVAPWLARLCDAGTRVAALQNGIGHVRRVAPWLPIARAEAEAAVVPAVVYFNAERLAHDRVRFGEAGDRHLSVPDDEGGRALSRLFEGSRMNAHPNADFVTLQWRKLLLNAVANPITALTRQRMAVLHHADVRALCMDVLNEAVAVGRASGARFADDEAEAMLATVLALSPSFGTSMYADCMRDRPLEVDALTGAIVAAGDALGVPTPVNRTMLALLRAISDARTA